jgi:hypothetical protein
MSIANLKAEIWFRTSRILSWSIYIYHLTTDVRQISLYTEISHCLSECGSYHADCKKGSGFAINEDL